MSKNKSLGNQGEDFAAVWLRKKGLKVLDQNFHSNKGEIDIVAYDRKEKLYIMVEVKTRRNQAFGHGIESVTSSKVRKIEKAAYDYFFKKLSLKNAPDFVIHAMVLTPNRDKGFFQPAFLVEYYDDLS